MAAQNFITQLLQLGVAGIDLKRSIDLVNPQRLSRMTNWSRDEEGRIAVRPGQRRFAWGVGDNVHSLARIQSVLTGGEFARFYGIGSTLQGGKDGSLHLVSSGFSGSPLTFLSGHPPLSGDSWLYVGDSGKMVKVRTSDELVTPLGLPPPTSAATVALVAQAMQLIEQFTAAGWTNNAGTGAAGTNAVTGAGDAVSFISNPGAAVGAYYNYWGKVIPGDYSKLKVAGGALTVPASDDDQMTFSFEVFPKANTDKIAEIAIYFVVSAGFDATVLPGASATINTDYFVKSFTASDFATPGGGFTGGIAGWSQWGVVGQPLRRGQFTRGGIDSTRGWNTITGMVIYMKTTTNSAAQITFPNYNNPPEAGLRGGISLRGGYNPDVSAVTSVSYDYICRNIDPRTGAKGRYAPVSATINANRQEVTVTPPAYGDSAIRQEIFRRGGTLPSDWYFVGTNTSDGGAFIDNIEDAEALAGGSESEVDFQQPVTTIDINGNAVYAQPIPIIFGPAPGAGFLLGLGDPYRPGNLYWSLPDQYDHWPLGNTLEVCSPAEELMNGGIFGGQAFAFSRQMLYSLLISIVDGKVQAQPTTCAKGLAARYAMAIGLDGIYFVSTDGIWKTAGGTPQNLTSDLIEPLFMGQEKNGYFPIDWLAVTRLRLAIFNNELWFGFQDTSGAKQWWVLSLLFGFWRHYNFGWEVESLSAEDKDQFPPLLLMGAAQNARVYAHEGYHDDGLSITATERTGALNQGTPRAKKLYGDLELEADLGGVVATVVVYADQESRTIATTVVSPQVGPYVYLIDAFGSTPLLAQDLSFEVSLTSFSSRPWIGRGGPSAVPQPEASIRRMTEWDNLSAATNKFIKGVLIEADTLGAVKTLQVMADGGTTAAHTFTLQTTGRQFVHVAFDSQIDARLVRLQPSDNSPWIPYEIRWLFDQDPLELSHWQTQEVDHAIPDEQTLLWAYVTLRSTADVTMTIQARRTDGTTTTGTVTIPSTGGNKRKVYVTLPLLKGLLFQYLFDSEIAFRLFREESSVILQPWGGDAPVPVQPFGTDALDSMRFVRDAEGAALRGQKFLNYGGAPDAGTGGNAG